LALKINVLISVKKLGVVLSKSDKLFESNGVLNPAVIVENGLIHMFYRAVTQGNHSTIGYCNFKNPIIVNERMDVPLIIAELEFEKQGVEDGRIVKIDDVYYLSYCGYDGINAFGALAISTDLKNFKKLGIFVPVIEVHQLYNVLNFFPALKERYLPFHSLIDQHETKGNKIFVWDKNVIFFPRKINGQLVFLHRIKPDIQIVCINELADINAAFWENYFLTFNEKIVLTPDATLSQTYIGGGCPPIETAEGWLLIYHSVKSSEKGNIYSACAALLKLDNPQTVIAKLPYVLFTPDLEWELNGEVNNVCFPTGSALINDLLYIYYGGADEKIGCASVGIQALLTELLQNSVNYETEISIKQS
jgi:beta-1,2-mannobiose phosphorylase / 1,2-beta-oligomannan phosphorylase